MEDKLLKLFNVNSHAELMEYIKNNPDDERVKEMKELLKMFDINIDESIENKKGELYE